MATNQTPSSLIQIESIIPEAHGSLQSPLTQGSQDMSDFAWPEEQRPTIQHNNYQGAQELPVIDMAGLQDNESHETKLQLANQIVMACSEWGFFQLINHGVPVAELDEMQEQARLFFELPMDLKQRATPLENFDTNNMFGYGSNTSTYIYGGRPWNETFRCSWSPLSSNIGEQAQRVLEGQALHDFQSAMASFCLGAEKVAKLTLELCALGLGLQPETFSKIMNSNQSIVRLNNYPVCPSPNLMLGLGAHSDPYTLTLLHQCQVGGLQVCKDGKWITVKPRHGAFVVNVGDNLQALTNGRFKSVEHRAVLNDKVPRLSVVFFYTPSLDTVISAPTEIVQADRRRYYRSFTYGEYLEFMRKRNFKRGKNETWLQSFAV